MRGRYSTRPGLAPCTLATVPLFCETVVSATKAPHSLSTPLSGQTSIYGRLPTPLSFCGQASQVSLHSTTHQDTPYRQLSLSLFLRFNMTCSSTSSPAKVGDQGITEPAVVLQEAFRSIPSLLDAAGNVGPVRRSTLERLETTESAPFCEKAFRRLVVAAEKGGEIGAWSPPDIWKLRDRFQQWASNCGALVPARSPLSLEHRIKPLRNRCVGKNYRRLLGGLAWSLQSATDIAEGRRPNRAVEPFIPTEAELQEYREMFPSDSDSDSDSDSATSSISSFELRPQATSTVFEIDGVIGAIRDRIKSLFEMSDYVEECLERRGMN